MSPLSQSDLVEVSREVEVTEGVVVGGARDRIYGKPTWTPGGNTLKSEIITGDGMIKSVRAGLRFADFTLPSELVWDLHTALLEDFLRDTEPVSNIIVTAASLTFLGAGTHQDGSTGPVITAAAATFDPFLDFVAADDKDCNGCMFEVTTPSTAAAPNLWARMIKDIAADGSQLDIHPDFITGTVGQFGEPLTDEGPIVGMELSIGKPMKNRGITNARSVNHEFNFTDQAGGSFIVVKGQKCGAWRLGLSGKGIITSEFDYVGMDYDKESATSAGTSTVANAALDNDSMTAGEDLVYFVVGGGTVLSADNLTNFSLEGNGNLNGVDDVSGSRFRTSVTAGDIDMTGSLSVYHEAVKLKLMADLAHDGTRTTLCLKVQDPAGNYYWVAMSEVLFGPGGPVPGGKGSLPKGDFQFMTQKGAVSARTIAVQSFAGP